MICKEIAIICNILAMAHLQIEDYKMDRHQGQAVGGQTQQNVDYQRNQVRKTLITFDKGSTWRPIK